MFVQRFHGRVEALNWSKHSTLKARTVSVNSGPFNTTRWSLVSSARDENDSESRKEALAELYRGYWYPLFAYLRRKGYSASDSADYLQSFFIELMEKDFLNAVEPEQGRFRWFMMSAASRFAAKQVQKANALKRGGGISKFSIDVDDAERRYLLEPVDGWTPEKLYDRGWALEVLKQALAKLQNEFESKSKGPLFQRLQSSLTGSEPDPQSYADIATELGMTEGAVKVAAFRLRSRFRELLVETVSDTVNSPDEVDGELDELMKSLRGG